VQLCGNALSISVQLRAHIAPDASMAPNHMVEAADHLRPTANSWENWNWEKAGHKSLWGHHLIEFK